ncbi:hypothetical protein BABINDRAFT_162705 [Babjeviella inositovora NRRL Y-12698]|uniref:Uncharacterized protein n=1 Tax=Babjeviella inositovora NRRL Y-12698 TaxID=984486 RepID=A0A1E3QND1_9ASCO|nr:uncharacterized protein BABINDRAFT_162705 [Babjeviella inositovora NRRL Y-12698]ODQ78497.1 hypothetical protein BABINDRAFT_162705 [Babjeviella inositovora NRRL Y-12698]
MTPDCSELTRATLLGNHSRLTRQTTSLTLQAGPQVFRDICSEGSGSPASGALCEFVCGTSL